MIPEFIVFLIWFTWLVAFGLFCLMDKDFQIPKTGFFLVLIAVLQDSFFDLVKAIP